MNKERSGLIITTQDLERHLRLLNLPESVKERILVDVMDLLEEQKHSTAEEVRKEEQRRIFNLIGSLWYNNYQNDEDKKVYIMSKILEN